jgi:hypothetical protein
MSERYQFDANDRALLQAATDFLKKVAAAEFLRPAELVSVAKLQHVISRLPKVVSGVDVTVSVASPRRNFGEIETWHWWKVAVEGERLSISSGGHFHQPSTGGDTFTTMNWAAVPEESAESDDYRGTLWMVPDVQSFPDGVASIDLASGSYTVEITDEDNPLLEEDEEAVEEDPDEETDVVPQEEEDDELEEDEGTSHTWSVTPVDAVEERLASIVNPDEVDANEPVYAYGIDNCHFCGCALNQRGMFVDGWLRDHSTTGNMCAMCFGSMGGGIGWGQGQLFARQPDGSWRMVAGGRPADAVS